jgi:hypothetical protein
VKEHHVLYRRVDQTVYFRYPSRFAMKSTTLKNNLNIFRIKLTIVVMMIVSRKSTVELVRKTIIMEMMSSSLDTQSPGVMVQEQAEVVQQAILHVSPEAFTWWIKRASLTLFNVSNDSATSVNAFQWPVPIRAVLEVVAVLAP